MKVGSLVKWKYSDNLYVIVGICSNPFFGEITVVASPLGHLHRTYDLCIVDVEVVCE
jgi:hypothetical protein